LREAPLKRPEAFVGTFTEKLLKGVISCAWFSIHDPHACGGNSDDNCSKRRAAYHPKPVKAHCLAIIGAAVTC